MLTVMFITVNTAFAQQDILTAVTNEGSDLIVLSLNYGESTEFDYNDKTYKFEKSSETIKLFTNVTLNFGGKPEIRVTTLSGSFIIYDVELYSGDTSKKRDESFAYTGRIGDDDEILILLTPDHTMITIGNSLYKLGGIL